MVVITLLNQKGGVGKTSTCHHLAGTLAKLGRRVLLIDNDPQASLTQGIYGSEVASQIDPDETVVAAYRGIVPMAGQLARPTGVARVELIAGHGELAGLNVASPADAPEDERDCLRELLDVADYRWDVVLIDCPPNLQLCSYAALVASSHLVVPVLPEDYGAQGLWPVSLFASAARALNPDLSSSLIMINKLDKRLSLHAMYERTLREHYPAEVLRTVVPNAVAFPEAVAHRLPVSHHDPRSRAAEAMTRLAEELLGRVEVLSEPATADAEADPSAEVAS